ncbi:cell division protein FtsZ [Nonlabens ulvanivorans]|uniref:Cell division protein FtsZ n=1 Tax=Nonlabens ulvanivorans TaxID=906888 RepID=A0A090WCC8_NONUL|nr:hypothetical protein [Nonlabens ulvanivorans]GAL74660.1 cell division protein FtsZ [Nonlabens ulvanivorans]
MDLDDSVDDTGDIDNAFAKAESPQPVVAPQPTEPVKIIHTLGEEEPEPIMPAVKEENTLIPTTEFISNLNVVYEEVLDKVKPTEFVITEAQPEATHLEEEIEEEKDQFFLDFDMPVSNKETIEPEKPIVHNLEDIEVNDPINVIPVTEVTTDGITKYSLDDYMEIEETMNQAKPVNKQPEQVAEEEIQIVAKSAPTEPLNSTVVKDTTVDDVDLTDLPINEMLVLRAEERKRKMHAYNFKFKNSHRLEEIEKSLLLNDMVYS